MKIIIFFRFIKIFIIFSTLYFLLFFPIIYFYSFKNSIYKNKNFYKYFSILSHKLINSNYKNDTEFIIDKYFDDIWFSDDTWFTNGNKFEYYDKNLDFKNQDEILIENDFLIINSNSYNYYFLNKNIYLINSIVLFNNQTFVFNKNGKSSILVKNSYTNAYFNNFIYYTVINSSINLSNTFLNFENILFKNNYELIVSESQGIYEGFYDYFWSYVSIY